MRKKTRETFTALPGRPATAPLGDDRKRLLAERNAREAGRQPALAELEGRLLAIGGEALCMVGEPDLAALLLRGERFTGDAVAVSGAASRCHDNVAELCRGGGLAGRGGEFTVCTGYALSGDGVWRQHSWGLQAGVIVETTTPRLAYYGVRFDAAESERFAARQLVV